MRHEALTRASYRVQALTSFGSLLVLVIPLYFVADALQPVMAKSIAGEGQQYFAFVLIGMIVMRFCTTSVNSLPRIITGAIRTGTLEALFATPASLPVIVAGLLGFSLVWTGGEAIVLLTAGMALGARVLPSELLLGLAILALITLTYLSVGVMGVALHLMFRTTGPLLTGVLLATSLLGGVYYPTHVIPSWLQSISSLLPMTYGLRALRQALLEGASLQAVSSDLAVLLVFVAVLLPASWILLQRTLHHARLTGTLAHY